MELIHQYFTITSPNAYAIKAIQTYFKDFDE